MTELGYNNIFFKTPPSDRKVALKKIPEAKNCNIV